ncbi:MAG: hypothetical protein ABIL58_07870 [Pseudomonadota bacterium]
MTTPPFSWIPGRRRLPAFIVTTALAVVLLAALMVLDRPLRTIAAPDGIVSFEVAGSMDSARRILDSWPPEARVAAGLSLGLDYLFLVAYAAAIAMGCGMVADRLASEKPGFSRLGTILAWGQFAAAGCDMVENVMLILMLQGHMAPALPAAALGCALVKFTVIGAGLFYAGAGGVLILAASRAARGSARGGDR